MVSRLPPLKSVEAFVAAGRLLSFGQAAAELNLSHSAISRRIQSLETDLGIRLFVRHNKSIALTEQGQAYLNEVGPAFDAIWAATVRQRGGQTQQRFKLSAPQSFTSQWLIPRLSDFYQAHPEIALELESLPDITGTTASSLDIAIVMGSGRWRDRHADHLLPIDVYPVCSPGFVDRGPPLNDADDLQHHTMLHIRQLPSAWPEWLRGVRAPHVVPKNELIFNDAQLAYEAARNGIGVALGAEILVKPFMEAGLLVAPIAERVRSAYSYYLVCRHDIMRNRAVGAFRDWLLSVTHP